MSSPMSTRQAREQARRESRELAKRLVEEQHHPPSSMNRLKVVASCRVCANPHLSAVVNRLIAYGMRMSDIQATLEPINEALPATQRIGYETLKRHKNQHFAIHETAQALYRSILEERAQQQGIDIEDGAGTVLTPLAYMDVLMQKGYETLVDEETVISPETGLRAAEKLQTLLYSEEAAGGNTAEVMMRFDKLVTIIKEVVPTELWPVITRRLAEESDTMDTRVTPGQVLERGHRE